ncbi:type II secretion system F family protein [Rhizobium sp. C4]|uniref:type II secretion system F family protein n=1 Tax=Rhizobium sp. C4 TaxID=1349800 RepID=UPI001E56B897|nr:type II secretion system F family protein [Rhizobium sp. C4]MCD2172648.1 type II secretion system F family protein [Rhizobium sp. C4]
MFGFDPMVLAIIGLAAIAAAAVAYGVLFSEIENQQKTTSRYKKVKAAETDTVKVKAARDRMQEATKRRKSIQDSLSELEKKQEQNKKVDTPTLKVRLLQAGLAITESQFYIGSAIMAFGTLVVGFIMTADMSGTPAIDFLPFSNAQLGVFAIAFVMGVGAPRFVVGFLYKRRMKRFLNEFPNSLDIMVRSIKSGLPLNDAVRLIAMEGQEPVKSEFRRVVEAQQMGMSIADACARMNATIPLQEVKFFAIVIGIQAQAGGNLSEALGNLSRVLRDRKKMLGKVQALSMEAKASAAIIGALPFIVATLVSITSPDYIKPLFTDPRGHLILLGSAVWMSIGVLVMRKMINFDI